MTMASMLSLFTLLAVFVLNSESASVAFDKKSMDYYSYRGVGSECLLGSQRVSHGQIFTDPDLSKCLKFRCEHGTQILQEEGCEGPDSQCRRVGERWTTRCVTYVCTKTSRDRYNFYQSIVDNAKCMDVNGQCHSPGDFFPYRLNGRVYNRCKCNIIHNQINYKCWW